MVASPLAKRQPHHHNVDEEKADNYSLPTKLFCSVGEREWEEVVSRCEVFPDEAREWIVHKDDHCQRGISWRRLPLHEACIRRPTASVVDALIQAYPLGAREKDHNGRLPLHHACFYGASKDVVQRLLIAFPESIESKDVWEKTPLSVAQASTSRDRQDIIDALSLGPWHYLKIGMDQEKKWSALKKHLPPLNELSKEDTEALIARLKTQIVTDDSDENYAPKEQNEEETRSPPEEKGTACSSPNSTDQSLEAVEVLLPDLEEAKASNAELKRDLEAARLEAAQAKEQAKLEKLTNTELNSTVHRLRTELERSKSTTAALEKEVAKKEVEIVMFDSASPSEATNAETVSSKDVLREKLSSQTTGSKRSESPSFLFDGEESSLPSEDIDLVFQLMSTLTKLRNDNRDLSQKAVDFEDEVAALKERLQDVTAKIEREHGPLENEVKEARTKIEEMTEAKSSREMEMAELTAKLDEANKAQSSLEVELTKAKERSEELMIWNDTVTKEKNALEQRINQAALLLSPLKMQKPTT